MVRCPKVPYKEFISAVADSIFQFLGLWALICFILALYAFISFYFSFWAFVLAFRASILASLALGRGYPLALCGLLGLQGGHPAARGGHPIALCGFHQARGRDLPPTPKRRTFFRRRVRPKKIAVEK